MFFDPDADEPVPLDEARLAEAVGGVLRGTGIAPDAIYATEATGGLILTEMNEHLVDRVDREAWMDAASSHQTACDWIGDGDPYAYRLVLRRAAIDLRAGELRAAEHISTLVDPTDEDGFQAAEQWLAERADQLDAGQQSQVRRRAASFVKDRLPERADVLALTERHNWSQHLPAGSAGWWALVALASGVDTVAGVVALADVVDGGMA